MVSTAIRRWFWAPRSAPKVLGVARFLFFIGSTASLASTLETDKLRISMTETEGGVVLDELVNRETTTNILFAPHWQFFEINLRTPDGRFVTARNNSANIDNIEEVAPWAETKIVQNVDELVLTFTNLKNLPYSSNLEVEVRVRVSDGLSFWRLKIRSVAGNLQIREVLFPAIYTKPLGKNPQEDVVHFPQGPGQLELTPYAVDQPIFNQTYPSAQFAYQMLGVFDDKQAFYVGFHDPTSLMKNLWIGGHRARGANQREGLDVRLTWPEIHQGQGDNSFETPGEVVMGFHRGGKATWYEAAKIYQAFAQTAPWYRAARAVSPQSTRFHEVEYWLMLWETTDAAVDEAIRIQEQLGVRVGVHLYNWHQFPFDDKYPEYFPAKKHFRAVIKRLGDAGIVTMPYINARIWDTSLASFVDAKSFAAKRADSSLYLEPYGGNSFAVMCPATEFWQDKVAAIVEQLISDFGVDGVYLDQVAASAPAPCFDPTHNHPLGNSDFWIHGGYEPLVTKIRASLGNRNFLTTENHAEPYLHLFDGLLSWNWQSPNMVPIYPSIYGGTAQTFGRAFHRDGSDSTAQSQALIMKTAQQFLFGEALGWVETSAFEFQAAVPFIRQAVQARKKYLPFFKGQLKAPPVVDGNIPDVSAPWVFFENKSLVTMKAVQAAVWERENGEQLLVVSNVSESAQVVRIAVGEKVFALALEPHSIAVEPVSENHPTCSEDIRNGATNAI